MTKTKECREEKKDVCPFLLLENSRSLSPQGPPDLSTCLGIYSLTVKVYIFFHMDFHGEGVGREKTRKNCNSRQPDLTVVDHVCVCVCVCVCEVVCHV